MAVVLLNNFPWVLIVQCGFNNARHGGGSTIKRIGCVTRHNYPSDQEIRVTKFAAGVAATGNKFIVLCPGESGQEAYSNFPSGQIRRLLPIRWLGRIGRILLAPLPINPFWLFWLGCKFRQESLDLVIVRDLRLAVPTIFAARLCGIRAILDLGEHYPGMMEIVGKQHAIHYITRNDFLIRWLEKFSVYAADSLWVVAHENKQRLAGHAKHIEVICNFPVLDGKEVARKSTYRRWSPAGDPVVLTSLGLIDNIRGLDLAVEAFDIVNRKLGNVRLVIYGNGAFRPALELMVQELGLNGKIIFGGWISEDRKYEALAEGDIGLVLHKVCDLTQHTIPNKLFDYMAVGLPVMATQLRPVARVLENEDCGVCVAADATAVAYQLIELILDAKRREEMGVNGRNAIKLRYAWETESTKIMDDIDRLLQAG